MCFNSMLLHDHDYVNHQSFQSYINFIFVSNEYSYMNVTYVPETMA
jgi:hypothetical protein